MLKRDIAVAIETASCISRSSGPTRLTKPMRSASSEPTMRPGSMMSFARGGPTKRGGSQDALSAPLVRPLTDPGALNCAERREQVVTELDRHGVQHVGTIHRDDRDVVVRLVDADRRHASSVCVGPIRLGDT